MIQQDIGSVEDLISEEFTKSTNPIILRDINTVSIEH